MNYPRLLLAAVGAFVAYFLIGGLAFAAGPLAEEFRKYPAVYRPKDDIMAVMPAGMIAMFVSMLVMAFLYAMIHRTGAGIGEGARFGALIGLFAVCAFVVHNYVNLNIGVALTVGQAIAYFVEWTVAGVVISLLYRPTP